MEKVNLSSDKFQGTQDSTKYSCSKDIIYRCSWHQRNYKCSFCKKEFNSAQALGGHMNVHRRDRAKMRLSPSCDHGLTQNPKPNTNPNPYPTVSSSLPSPSPASKFLPRMTLLSSVTEFSSPSSAYTDEEKLPIVEHSLLDPASHRRGDVARNLNKEAFFQVEELTSSAKRNESRVWKKREMVRLGFDMDLHQDAKEELDLELRLGYT